MAEEEGGVGGVGQSLDDDDDDEEDEEGGERRSALQSGQQFMPWTSVSSKHEQQKTWEHFFSLTGRSNTSMQIGHIKSSGTSGSSTFGAGEEEEDDEEEEEDEDGDLELKKHAFEDLSFSERSAVLPLK